MWTKNLRIKKKKKKKEYTLGLTILCVRIREWFRGIFESFFNGLEKIENKRLK